MAVGDRVMSEVRNMHIVHRPGLNKMRVQRGDGRIGQWSRRQLRRMDSKFCTAIARALKRANKTISR